MKQPKNPGELAWAALLEIGRHDLVPYITINESDKRGRSGQLIPHILNPEGIEHPKYSYEGDGRMAVDLSAWFNGILPDGLSLSDVALLERAMQLAFGGYGAEHECLACNHLFDIAKAVASETTYNKR